VQALLGGKVKNGSTAPQDGGQTRPRSSDGRAAQPKLDAAGCAAELLTIVAYITADDGPLQVSPDPAGTISPWHRRLLLKAMERLDIIDAYMRGRVAFLVAGPERGYHAPEQEIELAGATLDTCRATIPVVDALLSGRLPSTPEFEAMGRTALAINPALDRLSRSPGEHGAC
jgi:hypothetical protein